MWDLLFSFPLPKLCIASTIKTQVNIVVFGFWADVAARAALKLSAIWQSILLLRVNFCLKISVNSTWDTQLSPYLYFFHYSLYCKSFVEIWVAAFGIYVHTFLDGAVLN